MMLSSKLLTEQESNRPPEQFGSSKYHEKDDIAAEHRHSPAVQKHKTSALVQLLATIHRQMIQKLRMPFSLLLEVLLPIVFVLGLVGGEVAAGISWNSGATFLRPASTSTTTGVAHGPTPLAFNPNIAIRQRFCYNGTEDRLNEADASAAVYGGNCSDGLLSCNRGVGPVACNQSSTPLDCTDRYAAFGIPPGFCFYPESIAYIVSTQMQNGPQFVYDFDVYVLLQWAALIQNGGPFTDAFTRVPSVLASGPLNFAPSTWEARYLMSAMNATFPLFRFAAGAVYESRSAAMSIFVTPDGEGQWGLVDVEAMTAEKFAVSIALNRTAIPFTTMVLARFSGGLASTAFRQYANSGFVTLQAALYQAYSQHFLNQSTPMPPETRFVPPLVVAPMGYIPYKSSLFLSIAGSALAPLTLVLSFLYMVSQLAKRLVEEKELRLREGTMVMGLGKFAFYASWVITYIAQVFFSSVLITVVVKAGLIKQSDPFLIFVLYFLFGVTTVLLAALLSSFFSKSRITALVVPLIYFALSIPSFSLPDGTSRGTFVGLSLFSPTAFGVGTRLLFSYEVNNGMGWGDIRNTDDIVNMASVFGLLLFDCILYFLLAVYFDDVLPSEWGTRKHPLYCCCICCSCRDSDNDIAVGTVVGATAPIPAVGRSAETLEEYPINQTCTVHLQSLRKEFDVDGGGTKVAVDDLDLKIFPDQITVLLGHNGAGKTTTMNLITGMLPISRGDCFVYGSSSRHNIQAVRQEIGFCPQHNILWPNLTCAEHLRYFARLKGVPLAKVEAEVDYMLKQLDLVDKKDTFSEMLSGGQKRKLSVAIAFVGGSRLILLDEPTAGMDQTARRHLWGLLKEMSVGRTIILTTHMMDEADLLGNRVAIMSKGSLHSYGSSMFLKARLGAGYVLKVTVEPEFRVSPVVSGGAAVATESSVSNGLPTRLPLNGSSTSPATADLTEREVLRVIQRHVPTASIKEAKGQEISYQLPMKSVGLFVGLIEELENPVLQNRLHICGVSMSVSTLEDVFLKIADEEEGHTQTSQVVTNQDGDENLHRLLAGSPQGAYGSCSASLQPLEEVYDRLEKRPCSITFGRQIRGLMWKRLHNARRDRRTIVLQIVVPVLSILLAMGLAKLGPPDSPELWLNSAMYKTPQAIALAGNACTAIGTQFDPTAASVVSYPSPNDGNQSYNLSLSLLQDFQRHGGVDRMIALSCEDSGYGSNISYRNGSAYVAFSNATVLMFNASGVHSLPQAVAAFFNGHAATTAGGRVDMASFPMPFTARETETISSIQNLIAGIFVLIPFTFLPSTYVAWIVKEWSSKAKHLQFVSGVNYFAYWISNFLFDVVSFLVTEALALVIFGIFNRTEYVAAEKIGGTLLLFVLYGFSGITSAYLFSFLFDNHGTAQNITMLANFLAGFALVLTMFILEAVPSTSGAADSIVFVCRLIPSYCLGDGILALASALAAQQAGYSINIWEMNVLGWDFVFMTVEMFVFGCATILLDHPHRQRRRQQLQFNAGEEAPKIADEDEDVTAERLQVESSDAPNNPRANDVVLVQKLRKVYPNGKVAVQNISFGVRPFEVFGFLGTNGAGKTTTMGILTSEFLPSNGRCTVCGHDVVSSAAAAQQMMGYCPQFDALIDLLTCSEHLYLYAALRGIPAQDTNFVVDALLTACDINMYRDTPSKKLSGGNKRKLSVAIALMGAPKLLLLDEPTAGQDPAARRKTSDVVNFVAQRSAVILTSHHLEDLECLAHRVAIMVDGRMRCIGPLEHLKRRFGGGYEISLKPTIPLLADRSEVEKVTEERCLALRRLMNERFPTASLLEQRHQRLTFALPNRDAKLSEVFRVLQQAKDSQSVPLGEYTVQNTSLEQVFLRVSEGETASHQAADGGPTVDILADLGAGGPMPTDAGAAPSSLLQELAEYRKPFSAQFLDRHSPTGAAKQSPNARENDAEAFLRLL